MVLSDKIITRQMIKIISRKVIIYFIIFDIPDFDIILGMDFLKRYEVEIDYRRKKVKFTFEDSDILHNMIISCVKARSML